MQPLSGLEDFMEITRVAPRDLGAEQPFAECLNTVGVLEMALCDVCRQGVFCYERAFGARPRQLRVKPKAILRRRPLLFHSLFPRVGSGRVGRCGMLLWFRVRPGPLR